MRHSRTTCEHLRREECADSQWLISAPVGTAPSHVLPCVCLWIRLHTQQQLQSWPKWMNLQAGLSCQILWRLWGKNMVDRQMHQHHPTPTLQDVCVLPSNFTARYISTRNGDKCPHRNLYMNVYSMSFTIAKRWEQLKCPLTDEWINKVWYIHTTEY